ncbi:hypothetical protein OAP18_02260 [Gammaproteobacteria bacterium]|nr:hypothetical protein [Gammaproteobacteria bacterium]
MNIYSMRMYYSFIAIALGGILILSSKVSNILYKSCFYFLVLGLMFALSLSMLFTDLVIAGYTPIAYSITRIPGEYYWLTQLYMSGTIILSAILLLAGAIDKNETDQSNRCRIILTCFSPLLIALTSIMVLMQVGFKINFSMVIPSTSTYLLLVFIYTESKYNTFKILLKMPYSKERRSFKKISLEIEQFLSKTGSGQESSLKSLTANIEKQIVSMAVDLKKGSQVEAASLLKISTSSVCRKKKAS